jgi:hypothetical protein
MRKPVFGAADGVSAAVVRREQFDVLAKLPAIDLVLDSVVGEMNVVIEVRQIVVARWAARRPSLISSCG